MRIVPADGRRLMAENRASSLWQRRRPSRLAPASRDLQVGIPTGYGKPCGHDLYCSCETSSYVCVAKKAAGQACGSQEECQSGVCDYTYGGLAAAECVLLD